MRPLMKYLNKRYAEVAVDAQLLDYKWNFYDELKHKEILKLTDHETCKDTRPFAANMWVSLILEVSCGIMINDYII